MTEICVNKVIDDLDTGAKWLVLWIDLGNEYGYWYDLGGSSRTPVKFETAIITATENAGRFEMYDYSVPAIVRTEDSLTEAERNHRDRIWDMMRSVLESEPDIYERKSRGKLLHMISVKSSVPQSNLYVFLDKYWRLGKTKNAFLPNFHSRGGKGKKRQYGEKRNGRQSADSNVQGKIITDKDKEYFAFIIKRYYLNQNKLTLKVVYEKMLQEFYSTPSEAGDGKLKLLPVNRLPTFRQFSYWYSKNRNFVTEQKKRDGTHSFDLNSRSITGRSDFGLMGPGAQFQIDATVGDVYLVSQFDRSNLIGRPVMYFVIDAFSRIITGMAVCLEGPSWNGMRLALANMAADKVSYCKQYGIEIRENEWPCRHLPAALLGDRGELESKNADNLANVLGIRVVNAPAYRADLKGIIEQHFRTINTNSVALLPGSVKPDMSKRGGHDYRLDAKLDIRQFTQIIIKCVLFYNNHHYMSYYEKSEAMISNHVEAIPVKLWEWGIRNISGALRSLPEEMVRIAVMPSEKATVTERGIKFKGMFYTCEKAVRELWFERARSKKTRKVWHIDVSYDPRDVATIYVRNQGNSEYEVCSLLGWNGKNAGKCLDEIIYEQRKEKLVSKQIKSNETEAKVNLNAEIDSIVEEAQELAKSTVSKSKSERISGIKEHRREEREAILESNSAAPLAVSHQVATAPSNADADSEMSPVLRMIKQKVEERLKND